MALKCGIVGLPNVGKSTLFNCLSSAKAQAANYPFCTIEPNLGVISVPDERLNKLAEIVHPGRIVPATCDIVDIAGLVKGASKTGAPPSRTTLGSSKQRMTWMMASHSRMLPKNLLPSPSPLEAPFTRPAISTISQVAGTMRPGCTISARRIGKYQHTHKGR